VSRPADSAHDRGAAAAPRLRWWKEVLYAAAFYICYSIVRDIRGSKPVSRLQALHNAYRVIDVERWFGLFQEQRIQHLFIGDRLFIEFLDDFYGTAHFVVTLAVLIWLFRRAPARYPLWRNTLACTTALALIGFAFFPLMPPRLLPTSYHFVDTLESIGGLWSFGSGPVTKVSNQYAAMPSLHFAWSSWSALVLLPALRRPWARVVMVAYPFLTLFCIVVTANHYILDAAGGAVALGVGFGMAFALTRATRARTTGRQDAAPTPVARRSG
jgi:PAP2 superfamily